MDELLFALADAVRTGTAHAMPALVGFYVVRVLEAAMVPAGFVGVAIAITRCVTHCNRLWTDVETQKQIKGGSVNGQER